MKTLLIRQIPLLFFITITSLSFAQQVQIKGNIKGLNNEELSVSYYDKKGAKTDKIRPSDGKFTWAAAIPEAQKVTLYAEGRYPISVFVENGPVELTGNIDSISKLKVKGSKLHEQWLAFQSAMVKAQAEKRAEAKGLNFDQTAANFRMVKGIVTNDFAKANPDNPISLSTVYELSMYGAYEQTLPGFESLSARLKNTPDGKKLVERMTTMKRKRAGEMMVDFTQNDSNGKPVKLFDVLRSNKYVLIDFWASWCGPCRAENPNVLKAYKQYNSKGFNVIGVSIDVDGNKWKQAIKEDGMPWLHVSDLKPANAVASYYGIAAVPSTMLVDSKGKIIAVDLRGEALQKKLEEIFN